MKQLIITVLAAVGAYAVFEWYVKNPNSPGGKNVNLVERKGVAASNAFSSDQLTSGIPEFNSAPVANGHGDQVAAAYHTNSAATLPGGPTYEPAFGPKTNR